MKALRPWEIERARWAEPLPLDASWSTGDEDFDARIHASLMQRDELLAELKAMRLSHGRRHIAECWCEFCEVEKRVDAAIARAEGKS